MPRNVIAILRKDLVDATRQGRIVVILLTPLLLAIFYNFSFRDEARPQVKAIYWPSDAAPVMDRLAGRVNTVVDLKIEVASDADAVRAAIADRRADIGFVMPPGVEAAIGAAATPIVSVLSETGSATRDLMSSQLMAVFRDIAGQAAPATLRPVTVERAGAEPPLMVRLGPRVYFVLGALLMVVGMIAMIVVPTILAEESERHTLDALLMVGPIGDVIAAKALVGIVYIALSSVLVIGLTRLTVHDGLMLVAGLGGLSIALVGFGLLLGIVFRTYMQVSTWSGFLLLPAILPAFLIGVPAAPAVDTAVRALPSGQAMRLLANAVSNVPPYSDVPVSVAVIAAWGVAGYALLAWRLSRREA